MNAGKKETEGYSRPAFRRCNNGFAGSFTQSRNRQPDRLSREPERLGNAPPHVSARTSAAMETGVDRSAAKKRRGA